MRGIALALLSATFILVLPSGASADGGASLDFIEEFVPPGDVAEATAVVWMGEKDVRRLEEGPYIAYLVPGDRWIEPPRIPAGSIQAGVVEFTPPEDDGVTTRRERAYGGQKGLATVTFTVPDVPTDSYSVYYCNDPCTTSTIGDLIGGWIRIAEDAEESQLLAQRERFEWKNSSLEWRLKRARKQLDRLEAERLVAAPDDTTPSTIADLQRRLAREESVGAPISTSTLLLGIAIGIALALVMRRRRKDRGVRSLAAALRSRRPSAYWSWNPLRNNQF